MLEESAVGSILSRKAVLLMAEVLQTANRVLPLSIAASLQVSLLDHLCSHKHSSIS